MTPDAPARCVSFACGKISFQHLYSQIPTGSIAGIAGPSVLLGVLFGILIAFLFFRWLNRGTHKPRKPQGKRHQPQPESLHTVYNLVSVLSASLNFEKILDNILDLSTEILENTTFSSERTISAVLLFNRDRSNQAELVIRCARRLTPADMQITVLSNSGVIGQAISNCEPALSKNISQDPELYRMVALRSCQVAYCLPLHSGLDTYGVLLFAHPDPEYFSPERREILNIIGSQAVVAIQNASLYRDLEQEKERMQEIQDEARKKLARDLHDGPTQSVAAIAMRVNFARRLIDRDQKAAVEELFKVEDLARRTTKEIRHMLFTLRPLVLESQGLLVAFEAMADKMRETYNQNVIIIADPKAIAELEMGKQAVIFYIAEEAINNARKHAQAANIWVRLKLVEDGLALLEVEDNGVGFNVGAVDAFYDQRGSLGLVNMRERAELINGLLRIDSSEGNGTCIRVLIPLNDGAIEHLRSGQ